MKSIKIVFETSVNKIGYIIDPDNQTVTSGTFNQDATQIVEVSQQGAIKNAEEICKQIYYVLLAGVKKN